MVIKEEVKVNKKRHFGLNATLITILFIVAVILVNMIAGMITEKFPSVNIDLSENGQFKISKATKEVVKNIKEEVKLITVIYGEEPDSYLKELLDRYEEIGGNIKFSHIDSAKNPTAVQKYGNINAYDSLIVESKDKYKAIDFGELYGNMGRMENAESLITNAIVFVTSEKERNILTTTGHGEKDLLTVNEIAMRKYFNVSSIDLRQNKIENCDILVIGAPRNDFTQQELAAIEEYMANGGNIQLYIDPTSGYLTNLFEYIKEWGVEVKNETVKENDSNYIYAAGNGFLPVLEENDITKEMNKNILYNQAYRLDILFNKINNITITPVLKTTENATTLIGDSDSGEKSAYNIALMSVRDLENKESEISKMFISGTTLFMDKKYTDQYVGNESVANSIMQNMLSFEDYVEIETKKTEAEALNMTLTQVIFVLVVILMLAIGIIVYGIVVWSKRRYL